jgi:hypothetical protein
LFLILDAIHIPSMPNDVDVMTQTFKDILSDIFQQRKNTDINDMCIDQLPLPASVTVKGPLNVQQYYDLSGKSETNYKKSLVRLTQYITCRNKSNTF